MAYATRLPYAAQTFSGTTGRTILMSWLRTPNNGGSYTGMMSLPVELSLSRGSEANPLRLRPAQEMASRRRLSVIPESGHSERQICFANCEGAAELIASFGAEGTESAVIEMLGTPLELNFDTHIVTFQGQSASFPNEKALSVRIFIDYCALEVFLGDGRVYFPCAWEPSALSGDYRIIGTVGIRINLVNFYLLE